MFTVVITEKGGAQRRMDFDKTEVTIGRVQGNDIILPKGNVSKRHSRIVLKDNRFIVVDLKSTNGTYVNGRKITSPLVVKPGDKIYIGDFIMTLEESAQAAFEEPAPPPPRPQSAPPPPQPQQRRRSAGAPPPLRQSSPQVPAVAPAAGPPPLPPREHAPAADRFPLDEEPVEDRGPDPRVSPPMERPRRISREVARPPSSPQSAPQQPAPAPLQAPAMDSIPAPPPVAAGDVDAALRPVMQRLSLSFDVYNVDAAALHDQDRWARAQQAIDATIRQLESEGVVQGVDREALAGAALREAVGLGALEGLLSDDAVREIVVEDVHRIVADYGNGLESVSGGFSSSDAALTIARRLIAQAGEQLDPSRAIYETSLPYGPHVTVVLPPVAVRNPIIEIRRMAAGPNMDALVAAAWLSGEMRDLIADAVVARRNVLVCGSVGSGVTTMLGATVGFVDDHERIVTVEDIPDLFIERDHVIALSTGRGRSGLLLSDVLAQGSKLRADRLVVDDVRGDEALDVLSTVAARRPGNFIGLHSGEGHDALKNLRNLVQRRSNAAGFILADLIARSVSLVVEVALGDDRRRRVVRIAEVTGADGEELQVQELYAYDGEFASTGNSPSFRV